MPTFPAKSKVELYAERMVKMSATKGYVEHVALHVENIEWYIRYFQEIFGMETVRLEEKDGSIRQAWLHGGIQLTYCENFKISEPKFQGLTHIGIVVEDVERAIEESQARGLCLLKDKKDWICLPNGVLLEIKHAEGSSVADALKIQARKY